MYAVAKVFRNDRGQVQIRTFGKVAVPQAVPNDAVGSFALVEILGETHPGEPRGVFNVSILNVVGRADIPPMKIIPTQFSVEIVRGIAVVTPNAEFDGVPLKLLGDATRRQLLAWPGVYAAIVSHGKCDGGWSPGDL